jgi:DNA/RNA endonuclease YhcR with UshA esterase domain
VRISSWLLVLAILAPAGALAQADAAGSSRSKVKYDPATVVTVKGTVLGETRVDRGKGHKAVHLVVKVGDEQVSVHLGPDNWVDRQSVKFAKGDEVTVKGSKFTYNGKYGVIAQSVAKGGETLTARDAAGKPAWGKGP